MTGSSVYLELNKSVYTTTKYSLYLPTKYICIKAELKDYGNTSMRICQPDGSLGDFYAL